MAKEFIKELLHWWRNLSPEEQENCALKKFHIENNHEKIWNKFITNYKVEQKAKGKKIPEEVNEFGEKNKKYSSFVDRARTSLWNKLTEMRTWEEKNLEWMYERTMALNDALFPEKTFFIPNQLTGYRVDTFFTKEPETLDWIGLITLLMIKKLFFGISDLISDYTLSMRH